jgi:glycosyltransferase involved in cell wall biosynthesis
VGLAWPPDTFLQWKLAGLAERGFRITVVSFFQHGPPFSIEGVDVLGLPDPKTPDPRATLRALVLGLVGDCLALAFRHPRRLLALLVAFVRPSRRAPERAARRYRSSVRLKLREEVHYLRVLLRLAPVRPDVAHFEWESAAVTFRLLDDVWRCPIVISCHGGLQLYGQLAGYRDVLELLPGVFARAAAVQCVSELERGEAIRNGLDPSRARLVPAGGIDPAVFSPPQQGAREADRRMRLVAVGWLRWVKGYEYALRTLRALLDAGVPATLDVFGGDPLPPLQESSDRARILHTVFDLGLDGHVRIHGHVPTTVLIEHLRSAHALLHSSLSEGLPVAVLEALACELPVVATDCGGIRQTIRDGVDGFVVPPRDSLRAAAVLERLWREPELRAQIGRAGRARVQAAYTLEGHLNAMEMLYRDATAYAGERPEALPADESP